MITRFRVSGCGFRVNIINVVGFRVEVLIILVVIMSRKEKSRLILQLSSCVTIRQRGGQNLADLTCHGHGPSALFKGFKVYLNPQSR